MPLLAPAALGSEDRPQSIRSAERRRLRSMRMTAIALVLCLSAGCKTSVEPGPPPPRPSGIPKAAEGAQATPPRPVPTATEGPFQEMFGPP